MKKFLILITILIIFLAILFYILANRSYMLTKKAEDFYRENRIEEAKNLVNKALKLYKFNKKAIILKTKINKNLQNKENLKIATELYEL